MLYRLARFLQILGLVILPVAVAGNVAERLTLWQCLSLASAGMLAFYLGWFIQPRQGP